MNAARALWIPSWITHERRVASTIGFMSFMNELMSIMGFVDESRMSIMDPIIDHPRAAGRLNLRFYELYERAREHHEVRL